MLTELSNTIFQVIQAKVEAALTHATLGGAKATWTRESEKTYLSYMKIQFEQQDVKVSHTSFTISDVARLPGGKGGTNGGIVVETSKLQRESAVTHRGAGVGLKMKIHGKRGNEKRGNNKSNGNFTSRRTSLK
jgi:hypothetical protein